MDSYRSIGNAIAKAKKLKSGPAAESTQQTENLEEKKPSVKEPFFKKQDEKYKEWCKVESVPNAIRVEQGEYAVHSRTQHSPPIGTHHVTPCVVICANSKNYYGLAHFDSYRTVGSLDAFFKQFQGESPLEIQLYGGKEGSDPLRTGNENKASVLKYIKAELPQASVKEFKPPLEFVNLVLYNDGVVKNSQFGTGIDIDKESGTQMRLIHNIGGIITALQSQFQEYIPLNFVEAYKGGESIFLLDRVALRALQEFDPTPLKNEEKGADYDPGGVILGDEMRVSYFLIREEVKRSKALIDEQLSNIIKDEIIRKKLIDISQIFIGKDADELNKKIAEKLVELYMENENNLQECLARSRFYFNNVSQYPFIQDIIPHIEKHYHLEKGTLTQALTEKFGDITNMAYGVDILSTDVADILNRKKAEKNPGIFVIQSLNNNDKEIKNTGEILKSLCKIYHMDYDDTLKSICKNYNEELKKAENIEKIISAVDEKNKLSKDNILQVLKNNYDATKFRLVERKLNQVWDEAENPLDALERVIRIIAPPKGSFEDLKDQYNNLAKAFYSAHLRELQPEDIQEMSFHANISGIKGVSGGILKNVILSEMKKNPNFCEDSEQKLITSLELTKVVRDFMPYKNDENALVDNLSREASADASYDSSTPVSF